MYSVMNLCIGAIAYYVSGIHNIHSKNIAKKNVRDGAEQNSRWLQLPYTPSPHSTPMMLGLF